MKIYNSVNINQNRYSPNFYGKGIELTEDWVNLPLRAEYHKDIAHDLAEGSKLYFKKHKDIDNSVTDIHNNGGLTVVFDIPNNEILKVSLENPLEYREHNPEFDIPFLTPVEKYGKTYIVKQPKADTKNITKEQFLEVAKRIINSWCELSKDGRKLEQYGLYNGKPYLIDTRCAMPMPNAWTVIVDEICKKLNKCYTSLSKEQYESERELKFKEKGYFSYHCDETPRKSLTIKGGLLKLFTTIKNNIKYRKNHYCIPYEVMQKQKLKLHKLRKI